MDKRLKTKWIKALRSGKYEQGESRLRSLDNRFCCLGVLANVVGCQWAKGNDFYTIRGKKHVHDGGSSSYGMLTREFLNEIGLDRDLASELASMNDGGASFKKIATFIEKKV